MFSSLGKFSSVILLQNSSNLVNYISSYSIFTNLRFEPLFDPDFLFLSSFIFIFNIYLTSAPFCSIMFSMPLVYCWGSLNHCFLFEFIHFPFPNFSQFELCLLVLFSLTGLERLFYFLLIFVYVFIDFFKICINFFFTDLYHMQNAA